MSYTISRIEPDGTVALVAYVDDPTEIGTAIDEDRRKIDYEAEYRAMPDKDEGSADHGGNIQPV